eukprot:m.1182829 g.1182829  ORF g.1182829 m.1182829 type:complete len:54 (-) comp24540_c1_seq5:217-378(-)
MLSFKDPVDETIVPSMSKTMEPSISGILRLRQDSWRYRSSFRTLVFDSTVKLR